MKKNFAVHEKELPHQIQFFGVQIGREDLNDQIQTFTLSFFIPKEELGRTFWGLDKK